MPKDLCRHASLRRYRRSPPGKVIMLPVRQRARPSPPLDEGKLPRLLELKYYPVGDAVKELAGVATIRDVFIGFQEHLYSPQLAA